MRADILIFCDGGLGNRINALVSGLAIARYFGLTYCVHWPINNWCAAPFQKIFANRLNVSTESISQLKGLLDDAVMLLHDEIASNTLGVKFDSAYRFKNLQDFGELASQKGKTIFYYPAVIPNWVPEELTNKELKFLKFDTYIVQEVKEFISQTMPGPFYGLHLRRTDLNVGLDDSEVFHLTKSHPEAIFFVCSDDPDAERLAAGHPNVYRRVKKFQIEKNTLSGDWLAQTHDDDGRLYYGNIRRNEEAVVEGAIDMLILAHSQIIGFSGSTFQNNAKKLGEVSPIIQHAKPKFIKYIGIKEIKRLLSSNAITYLEFFNYAKNLEKSGNITQYIQVLEISINFLTGFELEEILCQLAKIYTKENKLVNSLIFVNYICNINPFNISGWIYLAYIRMLMKDYTAALMALSEVEKLKFHKLSEYDEILLSAVKKTICKN